MPSDILIQLKDSGGNFLYPRIKTSNVDNDAFFASNSYVDAGLAQKLDLPQNEGVEGQVLLKTSTGTQWADYNPASQGFTAWISFSQVTDSVATFDTANTPVGVLTNNGNYYPVQKGSVELNSDSTVSVDVTPYLAYDGSGAFTGTWKCYFAGGTSLYQQWLQAGHQGSLQDFINSLVGQGYRYAFTSSSLSSGILTVNTYGSPVSITDQTGLTYPLQFGSCTMTGSSVSIDMNINCAGIGKTVTGTWYINFASGNPTQTGTVLTKTFISENTTASAGYWYLCSSNLNVTLPVVTVVGDSVKVSTLKGVDNVLITPSGSQIQSDSSFLLDAANTAVELAWNGTQWKVAEVVAN